MSMIVGDPGTVEHVLAERSRTGAERFDEVWDGVYFVSPNPNNLHQKLLSRLVLLMEAVVDADRLGETLLTVNITDRGDDWTKNYRIPDLAVFLNGTSAENRITHWLGGPDFAVEILSPGDRAREKLDFYARVGVREVLLIDRAPWRLELFRKAEGRLVPVAAVGPDDPEAALVSSILPLRFRLTPGDPRPTIEVEHADGLRRWTI